jgi:hypothetical protein
MGETPQELRAASGDGEKVFDDRAIFYLQFREQIEAWQGLRWEAVQAINTYMLTLGDVVADLYPSWSLWSGPAIRHTLHLLTPAQSGGEAPPEIGIGLGWNAAGVMPGAKRQSPWAGVRTNPDGALTTAVLEALDERDRGSVANYESSEWWPRWRYVPGDRYWWTDLNAYRTTLIAETRRLLDRYAASLADIFSPTS